MAVTTRRAPPPAGARASRGATSTSLLPTKLSRARPLFDPRDRRAARSANRSSSSIPVTLVKNPVMFVVEVGAALTTRVRRPRHRHRRGRIGSSACRSRSGSGSPCSSPTSPRRWRKRAARRRPTRCARRRPTSSAKRLLSDGRIEQVPASALRAGDVVVCDAGDVIPGDGEVIEGVASVDESVITGESAPVIRESGGDRSAVTGGTRVLSDWIKVRDHLQPGRDVPRPHDRAGRRRAAAEDAERDRAEHPDRRPDADLPAGGRHARSRTRPTPSPRPAPAPCRASRCWCRCSSA